MSAVDIAVIVIVSVAVVAVAGWLIYRKVKRKGGCCGCDCGCGSSCSSSCSSGAACPHCKEAENKK